MAKKAKGGLAGKLGQEGSQAVASHASDETTFTAGAGLPEGIEAGIAQLVECKFDKFARGDFQGEYYFSASGIVLEPKEVNGVPVEGLRTSIGPEAMCETPGRSRETVEDHVAWVLNEMRKLGVDTSDFSVDDLESTAALLKGAQPCFRFRTWKGRKTELEKRADGKWYVDNKSYKTETAAKAASPWAGREPRVNHDWRGIVEDYEPGEGAANAVEDHTEAQPPELPTEGDQAEDLGALAQAAEQDDEAAAARLTELAVEAGMTEEQVDNVETWEEVVATIEAGKSDTAEGGEPEDSQGEPKKGDVVQYKPPKKRKPVDCQVTAVFPGKQTCNLKNLDDGKVYRSVSWEEIG